MKSRLAAILCVALLAFGCTEKRGLVMDRDPNAGPAAAGTVDEPTVVRVAALLPVLNRTEFGDAPVTLAKALADALAARAPFKLIRPEQVPDKIQPLYELGIVPRFLAEVDESGRTGPEVARLVGQGLKADAVLVASVTFYQQFVDHMPGGKPGEAYTTVVGGEVHLVDARSGSSLWSAAKVRRDTGLLGYPTFQDTARNLAGDLLATMPK